MHDRVYFDAGVWNDNIYANQSHFIFKAEVRLTKVTYVKMTESITNTVDPGILTSKKDVEVRKAGPSVPAGSG